MNNVSLFFMSMLVFTFMSCDSGNDDMVKTDSKAETNHASTLKYPDAVYGVIDEDDDFHEITASQLMDYYFEHLEIDADLDYDDPEIIDNPSSDSEYDYVLVTTGDDGKVYITSEVVEVEDYEAGLALGMTGLTCTCSTSDPVCSYTDGCSPEIKGGSCTCTPCGGNCSKSSTITTDIASHFLN